MTPYLVRQLNYAVDFSEKYRQFASMPGLVLLESCDRSHGRYDILSAYPYERIVIGLDDPRLREKLNILRDATAYRSSLGDLPFQGGAIGYISYELGEKLSGLPRTNQHIIENLPLMDMGLYDWAIIVDHRLQKVTFFAEQDNIKNRSILDEVLAIWENHNQTTPLKAEVLNDFQPLISRTDYQVALENIHHDIQCGRYYQVNFTQPFTASYQGSVFGLYQQITAVNPVPYAAYLQGTEVEIMSFSPERFLLYDQGAMIASPIKGTTKRDANLQIDRLLQQKLLQSEKNRAENVMIVDLLRNDLGKISCSGSVCVPHLCSVESYPAVHHLVSTITAQCKPNIHPVDAFFSCFPGGSITGAPKLEAMRAIMELERYSRGVYCGAVAYFSRHPFFDTNIAIRTVTAQSGSLYLAAGGGIVMDSDTDDEYQECFIKIMAIINGVQKS